MRGATLQTWNGEAAVTLFAGSTSATFLPGCGMLCTSLRHADDEYVAWPRRLGDFRAGATTAIPLVHPWGNRLSRWGYRAAGRRVDLRGLDLPVDSGGLPMHGNLFGAPFEVETLSANRLRARLDYGAQPDRLRAFPFPHIIEVDVRLGAGRLRIDTAIEPTSDRSVPVSFCWHPYLRLPETPRREWVLRWPACEHLAVDERVIPTGERQTQAAHRAPLAKRTFDDHYALGPDRRFSISAAGRTLALAFDEHYPYAQLYVPPRGDFVAIEPMTAPIDALGNDEAPICAPGERFAARFTMSVRGTAVRA
jgi:aldose 1-epimerase